MITQSIQKLFLTESLQVHLQNCDSAIETCSSAVASSSATLERPSADDFTKLWTMYPGYPAGNFVVFLLTILLSEFIDNNGDATFEMTFFLLGCFLAVILFIIPYVLSLVYMLFGADLFLIQWVDNVLVWLIKNWVSNASMIVFLFTPFMYFVLAFSDDKKTIGEFAFN